MWQKWHCGRMCLSLKNNGRRYCTKGNFSLSLQSITNWSCHRDGACESSRWCIWIIAMERRCHRDGVERRDRWFYEKRLKILDKGTYQQKIMAKKRNTRMRTGHGTIKCRGTRRCLRNGAETGDLWGIRVTVANPQRVEVKDMAENINDAMSLTDTMW